MGLALLCDKFTQTIKNTKLYFVFIDLAGRQAASYCFVRQAHITASQTPRPLLTISTITRISTELIYIIIIIISLALLLSQTTKNTELYFVFIVLAGRQAASYCFVRQAHITTPQTPRSLLTITKIITEGVYIYFVNLRKHCQL